ncbi:MAG TPA: quinone-dependent dihydroorotate dehydrogenase [Bacteroidetes bacterium]|nr:quinone-dependent dihydroorotate dehydrogenase [Bacteroidota bacterium]
MYKGIIRPFLFLFDAEKVHHFSFAVLSLLLRIPGMRGLMRRMYCHEVAGLETEVFGLKFPNPVGLAAGFDKNGKLNKDWEVLGFGFVEVGTVTPRPQAGNPLPRLFRLPKDQAVINRMGFNNAGMAELVNRLRGMGDRKIIVGGNIGKNKSTPNASAVEDYKLCFEALFPYVDYFVVNVSSPNTPGLRELQEKEPLTRLLSALQALNLAKPKPKPLLLKIAPDLTWTQVDEILEIVQEVRLDGLVATNTTISRDGLATPPADLEKIGAGGLSGLPLRGRATDFIRYIREKAGPDLPLIAVGGIMTPADAQDRLDAGATLVQVFSGFVYEGPGFARKICEELERKQK